MDFWSWQQQQKHQYQSWQSQSYDPTAYNYHHQSYNYNSNYHHQYPNDYNHASNYSNAYNPQPQHEPPIHPPGVSGPSTAVLSQGQVQSKENAYQPPPQLGGGNIAAAATLMTLTHLTKLTPTMGVAERATAGVQRESQWQPLPDEYMPVVGGRGSGLEPGTRLYQFPRPPIVQSPQKFGGKRGGRPSRGGARGKSLQGKGYNHSRGGSRMLPSANAEASVGKNTNYSRLEAGPSTNSHEREANAKGPLLVTASIKRNAATKQQPGVARCELCKADCTSLEDLEQHKLGKRHKKNLKRMERLKNFNTPINKVANDPRIAGDSNPVTTLQTENLPQVEDNKLSLLENLASEITSYESTMEDNKKKDELDNPDVSVEAKIDLQAKKRRINQLSDQRHGSKRNVRGGRGGKRMRTSDIPRRGMEPSKPKVLIPLICDLCNVKCDTQEVLDHHLSGKKHMSKLKRFKGHQAMYGPIGLQTLYPPNPVTQTLLNSQGPQQALSVIQSSDPSAGASLPSQTQYTVA